MYTKINEATAIAKTIATETHNKINICRRKRGNKYNVLVGGETLITDLSPHQLVGVLKLVKDTATAVKGESNLMAEMNKLHAEVRAAKQQRDVAMGEAQRLSSECSEIKRLARNLRKASDAYTSCKEAMEYNKAYTKLVVAAMFGTTIKTV